MSQKNIKAQRKNIKEIAGQYQQAAVISFVTKLMDKVRTMSLRRRLIAAFFIVFKKDIRGLF